LQRPGRDGGERDSQADGSHVEGMVKTQTDGEGNQHADNFCARVKAMYPGIFIEIKENVHL
jgi:hypothetical protein